MSIQIPAKLNIRSFFKQLSPEEPCVLCGSMSHDGLWCSACDAGMPYLDAPHCPVCALPTPHGETCGQCLQQPPLFARTVAAFAYRFPADRLIQAMKYREQLALAKVFSGKLVQRIDKSCLPDAVIPMPLHPAKLRARGFNQAQLLAAPLAGSLGIPVLAEACHRLRDTPSQTSLPWRERSKNVRGAFDCDVDLSGKRIALVDDVLTSGASLNALAEAVRARGAAEISAWVIARALPHDFLQMADRLADDAPFPNAALPDAP